MSTYIKPASFSWQKESARGGTQTRVKHLLNKNYRLSKQLQERVIGNPDNNIVLEDLTGDNFSGVYEVFDELFGDMVEPWNKKKTAQKKTRDTIGPGKKFETVYDYFRLNKNICETQEFVIQIGDKNWVRDDNNQLDPKMVDLSVNLLTDYYNHFNSVNLHLKVIAAVIHMDEVTPHLHILTIPYAPSTKKGEKYLGKYELNFEKALSADGYKKEKSLTTSKKTTLAGFRNKEVEWMAKRLGKEGIELKQILSDRKHLDVEDFKNYVEEKKAIDIKIPMKTKAITGKKVVDVDKLPEFERKINELVDKSVSNDKKTTIENTRILNRIEIAKEKENQLELQKFDLKIKEENMAQRVEQKIVDKHKEKVELIEKSQVLLDDIKKEVTSLKADKEVIIKEYKEEAIEELQQENGKLIVENNNLNKEHETKVKKLIKLNKEIDDKTNVIEDAINEGRQEGYYEVLDEFNFENEAKVREIVTTVSRTYDEALKSKNYDKSERDSIHRTAAFIAEEKMTSENSKVNLFAAIANGIYNLIERIKNKIQDWQR